MFSPHLWAHFAEKCSAYSEGVPWGATCTSFHGSRLIDTMERSGLSFTENNQELVSRLLMFISNLIAMASNLVATIYIAMASNLLASDSLQASGSRRLGLHLRGLLLHRCSVALTGLAQGLNVEPWTAWASSEALGHH